MNDEVNNKIAECIMGWTWVAGQDGEGRWIDDAGRLTIYGTHAALVRWNPSGTWAHLGEVLGRLWEVKKYLYLNLIGFKDGAIWGLAHGGESEGIDGVDHPCEVACMAILEAWDA